METLLEMLKIDLGIVHSKRDDYLKNSLKASIAELKRKGIDLDVENMPIDDLMLVVDYTAYNYRNRDNNVMLSNNLLYRIRNRILKERSKGDENE